MRRAVVLAGVAALLLAGCDYEGASSLPLPGGAGDGGYEVRAVFDDVTNLVVEETCRAGDVVVGSVTAVRLRDDLTAEVTCRIDPDVALAGNAVATIRETSLLGERFVALDPPPGEAPTGRLQPGTMLDQADASVVPDVEVVLGALSQVLNGGGLQHVETISRELSTALSGSDLGGTTEELARFVGVLDAHRDDISDALDSVDDLAAVLADQRQVIGSALDSLPQGLAALERQRPRLMRTLTALGDLSDVAVPLIRRSKANTVADLRDLAPVLENLAAAKHRLARTLESIVTFPFPSYTKYVTKGDYSGMFGTYNLDLDSLNHLIEQKSPSGPTSTAEAPPTIPGVPTLPGLDLDDLLQELPDLSELTGQLTGGLQQGITGSLNDSAPQSLADLLTGGGS